MLDDLMAQQEKDEVRSVIFDDVVTWSYCRLVG